MTPEKGSRDYREGQVCQSVLHHSSFIASGPPRQHNPISRFQHQPLQVNLPWPAAGVEPQTATDWFHGSFIDGYEWVMAPNVIGMALWADGGKMMSKPYAATGAYVNRMSTYCPSCRYDPKKRAGNDACPLTTLYWDFLDRNREILGANPRMTLQVRNLDRIDGAEMDAIRDQAKRLRKFFSA
jgi:deoxyribodipyrimidine photolyase-like uncharacterized protein